MRDMAVDIGRRGSGHLQVPPGAGQIEIDTHAQARGHQRATGGEVRTILHGSKTFRITFWHRASGT